MFHFVLEGQGGDAGIISSISQLSANFLAIAQLMVNFNKSLLIFLPQFDIAFFIQKNLKRMHQQISDVQTRLQQHDCF